MAFPFGPYPNCKEALPYVSPTIRESFSMRGQKSRENHQARLSVLPRCRFAYAKQMQIESRTCQACLGNYAEMQLCLCKANANREQNHQARLSVLPRCSFAYAKLHFIIHIYIINLSNSTHIYN